MARPHDTDESSRLQDRQEAQYGVPKKGTGSSAWFFRLQPMLASAPEGAFTTAWDTGNGGSKLYGYYESAEQFYGQLAVNTLKCGYELRAAGTPFAETLAYGDVEWEGDQDTNHRRARELLRRLHNICETRLGGFKPEVYVLCGTRETKVAGVWKNSYHFIVANLYAAQCGDIKQLFQTETFKTGVDDDILEWQPSAGAKPKPIIDPAVYAKVQCMRMPLCTKRGSDVPLRRINRDPLDPEDDLTASFEDEDVPSILPALISIVDKAKPTMQVLQSKEEEPAVGSKRKSSHGSPGAPGAPGAPGRDARSQTTSTPATTLTYSPQLASEVADYLVATHPDGIGGDYETWRNAMFGALNAAGAQSAAPPEFVKMLKEWTRIRDAADHRTQEWPRIANGTFASKEGRSGDGATITMGSLVVNRREHPAACTFGRALNVDPLPNCRALLAPEDVLLFELFEQFLRHVDYRKTSFKWLVQFASYVVPKLKAQVYDTVQGWYKDITKEDFTGVWDGGKPSEIYEFACKSYLEDIVVQINSYIPPLVETTLGETDGEATEDGSAKPQEAVASVGHVRTSKSKAQGGHPRRFTKEKVVALIVKTSASIHSFETPETLRKAVHGALKGQKDVDKATKELLELWVKLQGKPSKTGSTCTHTLALISSLNF
jgi:hypothetical protein